LDSEGEPVDADFPWRRAVGADRVLGVIIGRDEEDVAAWRCSEERGAEKGVDNEDKRGAEFHGAKEFSMRGL
jgi:hypothetical protein